MGFGGLAVLLASGLGRDPSQVPSALIGQPVPKFSLPPVLGRMLGLSSEDLVGEVSLVNVFASWCVACREEHPLLMRLSTEKRVKIHGLNYKDEPENAARWLNTNGDPYTRTGADRDGRVAIDWGVYGVPETFVVGVDGRIAFKHIGPLSEEALELTILPLVARLPGKAGA
jgi:cytochrome c biogenesis protein CcmG/thiol:disulfide interchange protein DsbE